MRDRGELTIHKLGSAALMKVADLGSMIQAAPALRNSGGGLSGGLASPALFLFQQYQMDKEGYWSG